MNILSLFANIGVGNAYLDDIDMKVVLANELEEERCKVYNHIYPHTIVECGDITEATVRKKIISAAKSLNIELVIATPPCQGFSTLNSKNKNDPRNRLIYDFCKVVSLIRPRYVLLENVQRMLSYKIDGKLALEIFNQELAHYHLSHGVFDAQYFDTPQSRRRAIVLFSRRDVKQWQIPSISKNKKILILSDAIGDLPSLESNEARPDIHPWHFAQRHSENHIEWMRHTPTGKSAFENPVHFPHVMEDGKKRRIKGFLNTYKRMSWDEPAPALIMGSHMISSSNTVHPGRRLKNGTYSDARTLSVLEAMRVMGLPDNWRLPPDIGYRKAIAFLGEGICPKLVKFFLEYLS